MQRVSAAGATKSDNRAGDAGLQFFKLRLPPPLELLKAQLLGRGASWYGRARGFQTREFQIVLQTLDLARAFFQFFAQGGLSSRGIAA